MHFTVATAFVCALSTTVLSQTYGGASSSDLLGYRSSAGHYYNRSLGSKMRSQIKRRSSQKRPATTGTTTFRPVAPMLAPQQLAAKAGKDAKEIERYYAELLEQYKELSQLKKLPENDVARAASFAVIVSHDVYSASGDLSERQIEALREQMREVIAGDAEFQQLSDRQKQELYEGYAILGMYLSGAKALKTDNPALTAELRRMAQTFLEETFNAPVDQLVFTHSGVEYK